MHSSDLIIRYLICDCWLLFNSNKRNYLYFSIWKIKFDGIFRKAFVHKTIPDTGGWKRIIHKRGYCKRHPLSLNIKSKFCKWKEVPVRKVINCYIYYINRNCVVDALLYKKALARYANDAKGLNKVKGLKNNSRFVIDNGRVFIVAKKHIAAASEILAGYKKEYWA